MDRLWDFVRVGVTLIALVGGMATALASPTALTYQGRIVKSDGLPLQHNSVSFQFEITSSNGACVLYREQVNGINMTDSNGVFDVQIGASHSYPSSASFTILDSFNNSTPLVCDGGAAFTPTLSEGRLLKVQFHDGTSWRQITPSSAIRSVPFAGYSESAAKLGDNLPTDFVRKLDVNGNVSCGGGSFLTWNATTKSFGCAAGGGGGSGTVTNLTSANAYLVITNSSTTPTLTLNVGTVANTVAAGNDPRFSDSRNPNGGATGDLTGNYPNPTVSKIQNVGIDATAPTSGQVLRFNGTNWAAYTLPAGNSGTVTSVSAGTGLTGGTITSSGTIGLGTELAAINGLSGTGFMLRSGSGSYSTTAASPLASSNTLVQRDASGVAGFNGIDITGATSGTLSLLVPNITSSYTLTFPNAQGGANQVLKNNGSGVLSWAAVPTTPSGNCGANEVLTYTSGAFACVPDQTGSAGTGITSINGETGSTQSFGAIDTTATSLSWTSASSVHTLHIPMANTGSVSAGLISKAEYDVFNGKQAALGYTPLRPSNNLNDVSNISTARTNLGLGTAATRDVAATGDAAATEVVLGNDSRLATNSSITSAKIADGTIGVADLNIAGAMTSNVGLLVHDGNQFYTKACAANQTLIWSVANGWTCNTIVMTESDPKVGTNTTNYLSKWNGSALVTSSIIDLSGSVGVGTSTPQSALHVNGAIQIGDDSSTCPGASNVKLGALRYHGGTYELCRSTGWMPMGGSAASSFGAVITGSSAATGDSNLTGYTELFDVGGDFNPTTGEFTAPSAGQYLFTGMIHGIMSGANFLSYLKVNGVGSSYWGSRFAPSGTNPISNLSFVITLAAGDKVVLALSRDAAVTTLTARFTASKLDGGSIVSGGSSDNLGNHIATSNLQLGNYWLSNDGSNSGLRIDNTGKVGIGTASPTEMLEVAGKIKATEICIGTDCKSAWPAGGTEAAFGAWVSRSSGTTYQAATDGFVVGYSNGDGLSAYSDNNTTPTTERAVSAGGTRNTVVMPVRSGDYWRVSGVTANLYWIPGNGASGGPGTVTSVTAGTGLATSPGAGITSTGSIGIAAGGVSTTELASSSVNSDKIVDASIGVVDLNFAGTMATNSGIIVRDGTQFYNKTCSGNQTLIWSVANGWICSSVTLAESDPIVGANTTNSLSKWDGSALVASGVYEAASSIGIGTSSPASMAALDVSSTTKGFLPPRMSTAQRNAISSPATGLTIYNTDQNQIDYYNGTSWSAVSFGTTASEVPSFNVTKDSAQSLASGWNKITWNIENFDTNSNFASDRFTPTVAGKYLLAATVRNNSSTTIVTAAGIYKNGVLVHYDVNSGEGSIGSSITAVANANGTSDYFEVYMYSNNASTVYVSTSQANVFSGTLISSSGGGGGGSADNLGNHQASQNIDLSTFQLVGHGGSSGVSVTNTGNVGIGVTNPVAKLQIGGTAGTDGIRFPDGTLQTTAAINSGTNNTFVAGWPDAIQCTISSPAYGTRMLYLNTLNYQSKAWYVEPLAAGNSGGYAGYITFNMTDGSYASSGVDYTTHNCNIAMSAITAAGRSFNLAKGPAAQWLQSASNAYYNAGNVGIGTSSPGSPLTVAGTVESTSGGVKFPDGTTQTSAAGSAYYYGETTTGSLLWTATTWTDVTGVVSLTDKVASNIARSGSAFTFAQTGVYRVNAHFNAYGLSLYLGLRFRKTNGTAATLIQRTTFGANGSNGDGTNLTVSGLISVTAGDVVNLQYAVKNGTPQTWGSQNPLDGESMVTGDVTIEKVK